MAILSKGTTYADGDQITSTNLNALVDSATFAAGAVESGGGVQLNGSGQLKVGGNIDIGTSNFTATGTISLGATSFNDNNITNVGSIALDTITNDGTDVTIDSSGDIILDADGAQVRIKDDGTERFIFNTGAAAELDVIGTSVTIHSNTSDADIIFKGNDGGSSIDALTLDMSAAGAATFNDKITAVGTSSFVNISLETLTNAATDFTIDSSGDIILDADGAQVRIKDAGTEVFTFNTDATPELDVTGGDFTIHANTSDADIILSGNDGGSTINALTLDMSAAGAATFNDKITATELVISGNIDVDGTANLDVVDIDGAVDMASTLNVSGNVGVGTTSPAEKLEVTGNAILDASDANLKIKAGASGTTGAVYYTFNTDSSIYGRVDLPYDTRASVGLRLKSAGGYPITIDSGNGISFSEDGTEFAEFTNAGHFYHNLTGTGAFPGLQNDTHGFMSEDQGADGNTLHVSRKGNVAASFARNSNSDAVVNFYSTAAGGTSSASLAGTIDIDSATTVSIQNASDYRLKENIVLVTDGIDRLKQMPVYRFNFTHDADRVVDGFLAHEVQPVVPEAVKGEKDGMKDEEFLVSHEVRDEEGQVVSEAVMGTRTVPKYQTMDQSKLVPLLTAALQEAVAKIEALEARVQTLEG
jgi:cytoskeletal protein CcmA (bactofilin family)